MEKMEKWKEWRRLGIGSSDAPVIMGVSPWKTSLELWKEKVGIDSDESEGNWATRRGIELEPRARAHYELTQGTEMPVTFFEHKERPFLRASLDGYNNEKQIILEIKCPGKADHETAKQGKIPQKYWPQLQHQLMVTDAKCVHYYSFDGESGHLVEVLPDQEYIQRLAAEEIKFWECVTEKKPPKLSDDDPLDVSEDEELAFDSQLYVDCDSAIKSLEKIKSLIRERILDRMAHTNIICGRLSVRRSYRKGNIDYSKVPDLRGVDLEEYRKKGSTSYTFKVSDIPF